MNQDSSLILTWSLITQKYFLGAFYEGILQLD